MERLPPLPYEQAVQVFPLAAQRYQTVSMCFIKALQNAEIKEARRLPSHGATIKLKKTQVALDMLEGHLDIKSFPPV